MQMGYKYGSFVLDKCIFLYMHACILHNGIIMARAAACLVRR